MKTHIVFTIRKLLRLAKTGTPHEAALASQQAHELMMKYKVHVSLNDGDDHRVVMDTEAVKIAGIFWREQLLFAVARIHRCRALRQISGEGYVAVLSGDRADVEAARQFFFYVFMDITIKCVKKWTRVKLVYPLASANSNYEYEPLSEEDLDNISDRFAYRDVREKSETLPSEDAVKTLASVYFRSFLNGAVTSIIERLDRLSKKESNSDDSDGKKGRKGRNKDLEDEVNRTSEEISSLANSIGKDEAVSLQQRALQDGQRWAKKLNYDYRTRKGRLLLTAKSSYLPPPPEPSRFTSLEFETAKPTRGRKQRPNVLNVRKLEID